MSKESLKANPANHQIMTNVGEYIEAMIVVPPDGGWGWVVVFASFYCNFINGVSLSFGMFLESFVKEYNASKADVAISSSIFQGSFFLMGPVVSGVANRYGFRACAIFGGLAAGSGYILTSMNFNTLPTMYIFHGLIAGMGTGFIFIPTILAVGFYFEKWRAVATGIAVSAGGFGTVIWPIIIERILENYSWRIVLRMIGVLEASCVLAALLFRPLKPQKVLIEIKPIVGVSPIQQPEKPGIWGCCKCFNVCHTNKQYPTITDALSTKNNSLSVILSETPKILNYSRQSSMGSVFLALTDPNRRMSDSSMVSTYFRPLSGIDVHEHKVHVDCCLKFHLMNRICCCCPCKSKEEVSAQRPLYRDDIFYHSSLKRLPEYSTSVNDTGQPATSHGFSKESVKKSDQHVRYHMSVTRTATLKDIYDDQHRCRLCPQAITRTIVTMLDCSILKSPSFLLLAISSVFLFFGAHIPYFFTPSRGKEHNLSDREAAWLLSVIGIANTVGRLLSGCIATIPKISGTLVYCISVIVCGSIIIINEIYDSKNMQYAFALIYGLFISSIVTLKSVVIVELLGLGRLTNAFGLLLVFQGIGSLGGMPIGGTLRDKTGSYFATFVFSGVSLLVGGMLLIPLRKINRLEKRKT